MIRSNTYLVPKIAATSTNQQHLSGGASSVKAVANHFVVVDGCPLSFVKRGTEPHVQSSCTGVEWRGGCRRSCESASKAVRGLLSVLPSRGPSGRTALVTHGTSRSLPTERCAGLSPIFCCVPAAPCRFGCVYVCTFSDAGYDVTYILSSDTRARTRSGHS